MKKNLWGKALKAHFIFLITFLSFSVCIQNVHAEKFDQRYVQWKAQQQARDEQLKKVDPNYYLAKPTVSNTAKATTASSYAKASSTIKVNINTADVQQLQQLNGIGAKKAQAIIDHRQQNGKFKNIDELQNVKGIGPKMLEKNRAMLVL